MARPIFNPDHVTMMDTKTGEIPYKQAEEIITEIKVGSAFMQLAKAVPMSAPIQKFTKLSGVGAYWVDEAQRIKTSKPTWLHLEMRAHKLGVIIPTTKENLRYSVTDFIELMKPEIAEEFSRKTDVAAFGGVDSPFAFSILKSATATGNIVPETVNKYTDINLAMAKIEAKDKVPNGIASLNSQKVKYRGTKDNNGMPIFNATTAGEPDTVLGLPVAYMPNESYGNTAITEIVGDWNYAYYGILQGIEFEVSTEASLTTMYADDAGSATQNIPVNAFERDMAFLKATMMVGVMVFDDYAFSIVTGD